jgi:hypothetical protein
VPRVFRFNIFFEWAPGGALKSMNLPSPMQTNKINEVDRKEGLGIVNKQAIR